MELTTIHLFFEYHVYDACLESLIGRLILSFWALKFTVRQKINMSITFVLCSSKKIIETYRLRWAITKNTFLAALNAKSVQWKNKNKNRNIDLHKSSSSYFLYVFYSRIDRFIHFMRWSKLRSVKSTIMTAFLSGRLRAVSKISVGSRAEMQNMRLLSLKIFFRSHLKAGATFLQDPLCFRCETNLQDWMFLSTTIGPWSGSPLSSISRLLTITVCKRTL